jgi:AraC-like DNA-binding protein
MAPSHPHIAQTEELKQNILRHAFGPSTESIIPGLTFFHSDSAGPVSAQLIYRPMVCVMAQGEKKILLGNTVFRYTPANFLISSVDLPVTGTVWNAAPGNPYLSLSLAVDPTVLSELIPSLPPADREREVSCGLAIGSLDSGLLDCFVRLTRLLDTPEYVASVAPLITREVMCRILLGNQGHMLRQVATSGSRAAQVELAIHWLRDHYRGPFSMEKLAAVARMSAPSLHRHFRAVTAMSPLQYQKQLRLQEARRLLMSEGQDAATAGFSVGYASPSQFNREYHRTFGRPPRQDAASHRYPSRIV